ncbi:hypothetical protein ABTK55_20310, partial [Acinetobacter baumannii]
LQGRLDATLAENAQLRQRLDEMARRATETSPQPAAPTQPAPLTDSERKEYGEEFIDVVSRVALHAVQPRLEELGRR